MIEHRGSLLNVTYGIIVHGCNAQRVMRSGVAKDIRAKYPKAFLEYSRVHLNDGLVVGDVIFYKHSDDIIIANAITREFYGKDGKLYLSYTGLEECFETIKAVARLFEMPVHFPLIGCGLAGGEWAKVEKIINRVLPQSIPAHLWIN